MKRVGIGKKLRFEIFERDKFTCQYCGKTPIEDGIILHIDHVVSVKNGGNNDAENLVTSCIDCNLGKGAKTTVKSAQTPAEMKKQLEQTKERLEQVVAMNGAMREIVKIKKEIDEERFSFIRDVIGDNYNELVYSGTRKLFESKMYQNLSLEQKIEALEITKKKHESGGLTKVEDWLKYLKGVLKNISLSEEEKDVLKQYFLLFQNHYNSQMFPKTRQVILESSYWGVEYHSSFIKRLEKSLEEYRGKKVKANDYAKEITGIETYIPYSSGAGFNYFVCDFIGLELTRDL